VFEVGFTEILLILGLALLVLGPEKLPGLAEKVGRWTGRARSMARQLRTQLEHEVTMEELSRSRPSQPATAAPPPPDTSAASPEPGVVPTGPELNLDTMVSGVEPEVSPRAEFGDDAAADAAVVADSPPTKAAS
jgi:sec-independent protein translocase protein TatB